jgi:Carboxypeptidase regulatory-like domain
MRLRPQVCPLLMCLVLAFLPTTPATFAQSTFGEIRGTVLDPSGAVVSGAAVTAKNKGTGVSRTGSTDVTGSFSLVNLDAVTFEVAVESGGFRKAITQNVILRAREVVRVDTTLQLAEAATEVIVTDARQVITTDVATIADSKTINEIQNLPVNFRAGGTNSVFSSYDQCATRDRRTDPSDPAAIDPITFRILPYRFS